MLADLASDDKLLRQFVQIELRYARTMGIPQHRRLDLGK